MMVTWESPRGLLEGREDDGLSAVVCHVGTEGGFKWFDFRVSPRYSIDNRIADILLSYGSR